MVPRIVAEAIMYASRFVISPVFHKNTAVGCARVPCQDLRSQQLTWPVASPGANFAPLQVVSLLQASQHAVTSDSGIP